MRGMRLAPLLLAAALLPLPARADLGAVSPAGFTSTFRKEVQAAPAQAIAALARPDQWWNPQHTYSGQAANLRLGLRAGDCFCEAWDGNTIEHARVLLAQPASLVRLQGALGPLQELGAMGILTFSATAQQGKTVATLAYRVSGTPEMGLERLAPIVDRVMGEQFSRWTAYLDR
jgi:hypothetical protein